MEDNFSPGYELKIRPESPVAYLIESILQNRGTSSLKGPQHPKVGYNPYIQRLGNWRKGKNMSLVLPNPEIGVIEGRRRL